jgi:phospholipid/cholesterol/gamma-HCH transport system substrate-binding protein
VGREELDQAIARADSTLVELQAAGGNLARATSSLESILERLDRGEGTLGRLTTDEALYENFNSTLEEVRALARDLRENPGRYIRLRFF